MGAPENEHIFGVQIRESANDGSDFSNADSDYLIAFLGEDKLWHVKDSAGTVTDPFDSGGGAPDDAQYVTYASNGSLSAERVVETPATGGIIAKFIRKTSNEIVNNSATLQDDDALLFAIASSEVWEFQIDVWFMSGTTPDFKHAITVPASATLRWTNTGVAASGTTYGDANIVDASGTSLSHQGNGATTVNTSRIRGHVINSTNAGNVQYQWAQNTQNLSDTTVLANSTIKAWKLA